MVKSFRFHVPSFKFAKNVLTWNLKLETTYGVSFRLYHTAWISHLFTIYDLLFTFFPYQRIKTPPQVTPPPNEANKTRSPVLMRPASTHSSNPIGIEADEVLPCIAMLE